MKAVIANAYGDPNVLQVKEIATPKPKDNEILVKIHATSVTAAHCAMRTGKPLFGRLFIGLTRPKIAIPGTDLSGTVIEIGSQVSKFKVADEIIAATDVKGGSYAEYICLEERDVIATKPVNVSHAEASGIIDGGQTALSFLRDSAKLQAGQKILINGGSGSIGTAAIQLSKLEGAEVTAVCSTKNIDLVMTLGSDNAIDYTTEDITKQTEKYDVIFDTVGKLDFNQIKHILTPNGKYLSPVLGLGMLKDMMISSFAGKQRAIFSATGLRKAPEKQKDLIYISELMQQGKLKTFIDRKYSIEEVADAHKYVETGHKRGNIVIEM
jgi:NADPH:quinone reductase-like Zn-dependent oxidoreductase